MLQIIKPSAATITPNINFELAEYRKIITPNQYYVQNFRRLCNNQYHGYTKLYTDGSKRKVGVGAAVVWSWNVRKASLPAEASIFSGELHAIEMAENIIETTSGTKFVIFSDSYSVLTSLLNNRNDHSVARRVLHKIDALHVEFNKAVEPCWVPGHVGLEENELADKAAVAAASCCY